MYPCLHLESTEDHPFDSYTRLGTKGIFLMGLDIFERRSEICQNLWETGIVQAFPRIFYFDSGHMDEIYHNEGRFRITGHVCFPKGMPEPLLTTFLDTLRAYQNKSSPDSLIVIPDTIRTSLTKKYR